MRSRGSTRAPSVGYLFLVVLTLFFFSAALLETKAPEDNIEHKLVHLMNQPKYVRDPGFNYSLHPSVLVVMWDGGTPFGWGDGDVVQVPNYGGFVYNKPKCPVNCVLSTDRSKLPIADAVLFDVCRTGPTQHREVPVHMPEKRAWQSWWWFAYEQPEYFPLMREPDYMSKFDYKMVYHHDADVHITFFCPWAGNQDVFQPPPPKTHSKLVAFMGSNCDTGGAKRRTAFVQELARYIEVHSFGHCLHNTDWPNIQGVNPRRSHGDQMAQKIAVISQYKFYLAFENNDRTPDYVTEKIMNAFQAGSIPVYWGAPNIDMWTPSNHSIIKVSDFSSARALAKYLRDLDEDDVAYNRYFEWKKNPSPHFLELMENCLFFAECRLCKAISQLRVEAHNKGAIMDTKVANAEAADKAMGSYALQLNCLDCDLNYDDDYVEVPHADQLDFADKMTLTAWIKLNHIQDGRIIDKNEAGEIHGIELDVLRQPYVGGRGVLRFCGSSGCFQTTRVLGLGVWYHVAVTFQYLGEPDDGLAMYINGKLDSKHNVTNYLQQNNLPLRFGRAARGGGSWRGYHPSTVFDGYIDDVTLWNVVLNNTTINSLMFTRLTGNEGGLVGYYTFNEGRGQEVHDLSKYQNHGTIYGSPLWVPAVSKPLNDISTLEKD
jgi:hypothetical protein